MRATFIPALTRLVSTLAGRDAGPIVHTIFVAIEDLRSTTIPRRKGASSIPLMNFYASSHRSWPLHLRVVRNRLGRVHFSGSVGDNDLYGEEVISLCMPRHICIVVYC